MFKFFILLLFISCNLLAATPKLFKPIGDPIYKEVPAVSKLLKVSYFKEDKLIFQDFITHANAHKKLGLAYDKKKSTLSKEDQKNYLNTLRAIDRQLHKIHFIVHEALPIIIKRGDQKNFYRLKNSGIDVLHQNKRNAKLVYEYDKKLTRQYKLNKEKKKKNKAAAKLAYFNMLRSEKNLNGQWNGKSSDGSQLLASFKSDTLSLSYITPKHTSIFLGHYSIKKTFDFFITQRELVKSENSHTRHINLKRKYLLKKITQNELILEFKDETISLQRKK